MTSDRLSLACRARAHDECAISWCTCECHRAPKAERPADIDYDELPAVA